MKTIEEQAREYAKRWCEANGKNSRHVRLQFAADFAKHLAAPREELIAELVGLLQEAQPVLRDAGYIDLMAKCARHCAELKEFNFDALDERIRKCSALAHRLTFAIAKAEARQ